MIDERFWAHRRRATSIAGISAVVLAMLLFLYRLLFDHVVSWDLFAVGLTSAVVKLSLMIWYRFTD